MSRADATAHTILWRWLDRPGHDAARVHFDGAHWNVAGTAVFAHEGQPCRLDYCVTCDAEWRTLRCTVAGWVGQQTVEIDIPVDEAGQWRMNGADRPQVAGCTDIDLNFSPSTNLLPIRRLKLEVGGAAPVRAAWLRFPSFALEPLEQTYTRLSANVYRYESAGGAFTADVQVNEAGLVTLYPPEWQAV
jgi:uncharacterized protein